MNDIFNTENIMLLARVAALLFAIPVHEVSHAFVSDKLGDPTARNLGRLTLNPIKHFDMFGLLSMLIIGVGWAKPVPVDPRYYNNRKGGMALTAFAGPLSNLILAYLTLIIYKVFLFSGALAYGAQTPLWLNVVVVFLYYFAIINVSLALFNLLPIPPLDGSRIVGLVVPDRIYYAVQRVERYIMFALLAVVFLLPRLTGINPLGWLLGDVADAVMRGLTFLTGFVDAAFRAFL